MKKSMTLTEVLICIFIIGIISCFWVSISKSKLNYEIKMSYWSTVNNLEKATSYLIQEHVNLPTVATTSDKKGFCDMLAAAYNTVGTIDCTAKATKTSDFKSVKPNFVLSNGQAFYNLCSDPQSDLTTLQTSSFIASNDMRQNLNNLFLALHKFKRDFKYSNATFAGSCADPKADYVFTDSKPCKCDASKAYYDGPERGLPFETADEVYCVSNPSPAEICDITSSIFKGYAFSSSDYWTTSEYQALSEYSIMYNTSKNYTIFYCTHNANDTPCGANESYHYGSFRYNNHELRVEEKFCNCNSGYVKNSSGVCVKSCDK